MRTVRDSFSCTDHAKPVQHRKAPLEVTKRRNIGNTLHAQNAEKVLHVGPEALEREHATHAVHVQSVNGHVDNVLRTKRTQLVHAAPWSES